MVGKQEDTKNNKSLIAIFISLISVITALVVAIVVIVATQPAPDTPPSIAEEPELTSKQKEIQELTAKYEAEGYVNPEGKATYEVFWSAYNSSVEEANALIKQQPPNLDVIENLLLSQMDESLANDQPSYAAMFFKAYYNILQDNGFKKEAVETILSTDLTGFTESKRHEFYQDAVTISESIGDSNLIAEAKAKMATTQEAYNILIESTKYSEENPGEILLPDEISNNTDELILYKEDSNETNN